MDQSQYSGATTTANSEAEGRMKVDAAGMKKRKMIKSAIAKGRGGAAGDVAKTVSGALKKGMSKAAGVISSGAGNLARTLKSLDKAKQVTPVAPPGAQYHWDEDKKDWAENVKIAPKDYMDPVPGESDSVEKVVKTMGQRGRKKGRYPNGTK